MDCRTNNIKNYTAGKLIIPIVWPVNIVYIAVLNIDMVHNTIGVRRKLVSVNDQKYAVSCFFTVAPAIIPLRT